MTDANLTLLALIVDRSGSMSDIARDMNGGIATLLREQASNPGSVVVDIWTFDHVIDHPFEWVRPDDVKGEVIIPRGATALNDAVGLAVSSIGQRLADMDEDDRPGKVIVCIVTDGYENASRDYTRDQVREMITTQTEQWGWEFIYLAANVDAFATGRTWGFKPNATMQYGHTAKGAAGAFAAASSGITRARRGEGSVDFTDEERASAGGA